MRPKNWIALGLIIVLLVPSFPGAFSAGTQAQGRATTPGEPWWYPEWRVRAPILVANPNTFDIYNYSFSMYIPYDGDMLSNFSDLRFSQHVGNDIFEVPFWFETVTPGTTVKVWLKARYLPSNGDTTIYMYYKNPLAVPASSADGALAFYDSFDGTTLNTTRWNDPHTVDMATSVSVQNGNLDFTVVSGSAHTGGCVVSKVMLEAGDYILETRLKFTNWYRSSFGAYAGYTNNLLYDDSYYGNPAKLVGGRLYDHTGQNPVPYLALRADDLVPRDVTGQTAIDIRNRWFKMQTIYTPPSFAKAIFTQLESPFNEITLQNSGSTGITPKYIALGIGDWETAEDTLFDYVIVRKYAPSEPVGLIGKEEITFNLKSFGASPSNPVQGEMVTLNAVFTNPTSEDMVIPVSFRVGANFSDARTVFEQDVTFTLKSDTTVQAEWKAVPGVPRIWLGTYGRSLAFVDIVMEPDTVPPITTMLPLPKYANTTDFTVEWTSPEEDPAGVLFSVWVSEDNGATFNLWLNWTAELSAAYPGVEGGKYQFFTLGRDLTGNTEGEKALSETSTIVDATAPRTSLVLTQYQKTATFYVNWSTNDTVSGVAAYTVFVSDNGAPYRAWLSNVTKRSDRFAGAEKHEYKFFVMARDVAGNVEGSTPNNTKTTRVDLTAPVTTMDVDGRTFGLDPVFMTPLTVLTMEVKDDSADVTTYYHLDGGVNTRYTTPIRVLQTGSHNISFWSVDRAGNTEKQQSWWFAVDGDAPATSMLLDGASFAGEAITFLAAGTKIVLDPLDEGSGVAATTYRIDNMDPVSYDSPFILDKPGVHTLVFQSVDNLGNAEPAQAYKLQVDSRAPTTVAVVPAVAQRYDYTVKLKTSDPESGVATTFFRIAAEGSPFSEWEAGSEILFEARTDHSSDGKYTIEYYSIDNVGHVEQAKTAKVGIDTLSSLTINIKGAAKSEKDVFTIIGQAEPGSRVLVNGLLALVDPDGYFTFDLKLKEGSNKVQVVAIDPAGNTEQITRSISFQPTAADLPEWMVWTIAILVVSAAACVITVILARGGRRPQYE